MQALLLASACDAGCGSCGSPQPRADGRSDGVGPVRAAQGSVTGPRHDAAVRAASALVRAAGTAVPGTATAPVTPTALPALVPTGELGVVPGPVPPIPGHAPTALDPTRPAPLGADPPPEDGVSATLTPRIALRGRVTDWRTGVPLARFSVEALDDPAATIRRQRSGGGFLLELAPGQQRLALRAPGYVPARVVVQVPSRDQQPSAAVQVELRPAGTVRGVLQSSLGAAIVGARVQLGSAAATTTDAEGRFLLEDVPEGIHRLEIRRDGRVVLQEHGVAVRAGQTSGPLRFVLAPADERPVGGGIP